METICLKGRQVLLTEDRKRLYRIKGGTLLIYITTVTRNGKSGRKHFLMEMHSEDSVTITSLAIDDEELGHWRFLFSPLTEVTLEYRAADTEEELDKSAVEFAGLLEIHAASLTEFEQEIVELMERKLVAEELAIFRNRQADKENSYQVVDIIMRAFHKGRPIHEKKTNHQLYNTVSLLCSRNRIKLVPYDTMVEACGKNFTLEDLARISHFMIREVHLEEDWFLTASGSYLVYKEEKEYGYCTPVACIPDGPKRFIEYDPQEMTIKQVEQSLNASYIKTAYAIYKPLPARALTLFDLIRFCGGTFYKRDITVIVLLTLIGSVIGLLLPYLNRMIYDKYIVYGRQDILIQIGLMVLAFTVGNLMFSIVKNLAVFRSAKGIETSLLSAVYDRLFHLPEKVYEQYESVDLVKRAMSVSELFACIYMELLLALLAVPFSMVYLFYMLSGSRKMTLIGLVMLVLQTILVLCIGIRNIRLEKRRIELNTEASSIMYQAILGIAKIKIAGAENRLFLKYMKPYIEGRKITARKQNISNALTNINLYSGMIFTIIFYSIQATSSRKLSAGYFLAFLASFGIFSASFSQLIRSVLKLQQMKPNYTKTMEILKIAPETGEEIQLVGKLHGDIEVNNVSFRYNDKEDLVLSNISFKINKGEYIGIVGSSGSGKSTLLRLLLGFAKPTSGKIYYDDRDIDSLDKQELRKCLGVVLQDGQLIVGSIYENIVIASTAVTKEEKEEEIKRVYKIIREVGLEKDISLMPMGLETIISEGAGTISGGQKQRLLIARAIFNQPAIIFFDEATSALDNVSQAIVAGNLAKLNATRVVIAHRLSTVEACDRILVMEKGRIIEAGTYEELMQLGGYFYHMSLRQIA